MTATGSSQFITNLDSITLSDTNRKIYDYWLKACGIDPIPRAQALAPVLMPRDVLGYFTVIEVIDPGPQFIVRLTGSQVRDAAGQDYTGQMVDQMPGAESVLEQFKWCVLNRRPYCARSKLHWSANDFRHYEALVLPFGEPDGRIEKIASVIYFSNETD